jgi:hypothetical protein
MIFPKIQKTMCTESEEPEEPENKARQYRLPHPTKGASKGN